MARAVRCTSLAPVAAALNRYVDQLAVWWPTQEVTLSDLGRRAHEVIENALEFQLTGHDDYGSGTTLASTVAAITASRVLLALLHPLLATRYPGLPSVYSGLDQLQSLLEKERLPNGWWVPESALPVSAGRRSTPPAGRCCRNSPPSRPSPSRGTASMPSEPPDAASPTDEIDRRRRTHAPPAPARRSFLRGLAGGVAGGVIAGGAAGAAAGYAYRGGAPADPADAANEAAVDGLLPAVPFHGKYQAGILPKPSRGHGRGVVQRDRAEPGRAGRAVPDGDRPRPVPDRRRHAAGGRHRRAAVGLGRARADGGAERAHGDVRGRLDAVRRPVRARVPAAPRTWRR